MDKSFTSDQIKKAYRKLAFKYHPDVSKDVNSYKKFLEIQEAYEILSNLTKRLKYDYLHERHYQTEPKTTFEKFYEKKIYTEHFNEWRKEAQERAIKKSKEKFSKFKEGSIQAVGKGFDFITDIIAVIIGLIIIGATFMHIANYLGGDKHAFWGVIICSILSTLLILSFIQKCRDT